MKPDTEALTWERWLQNGDADAFAEVSRLYAGMVYGTCLRITGDRDQAADAARETFFQLLTHARQVTGSLGGRLVEQCLPPTGLGGMPRLDGRIGGTTFAALSL